MFRKRRFGFYGAGASFGAPPPPIGYMPPPPGFQPGYMPPGHATPWPPPHLAALIEAFKKIQEGGGGGYGMGPAPPGSAQAQPAPEAQPYVETQPYGAFVPQTMPAPLQTKYGYW